MNDIMKYKGYYGSINFDSEELIFYGKLEYIKTLASYEAEDAVGIQKAFQETVDDYLILCKQQNIEPEQPFKGSFNVRVGHKLHEKIALSAQNENLSINKFVKKILEQKCKEEQDKAA